MDHQSKGLAFVGEGPCRSGKFVVGVKCPATAKRAQVLTATATFDNPPARRTP